jgi:hypothetical protein
MKVLLLSTSPLGVAAIDRVLLSGLQPSAVDVCPSVETALGRFDTFPPDLVIVNLPEPAASGAVRRIRDRGIETPTMIVASDARMPAGDAPPATLHGGSGHADGPYAPAPLPARADADLQVLDDREPPGPPRITDADAPRVPTDGAATDALDAETRWLLYEVASIGHVSTTVDGDILATNDVATQLLRHFSPEARQPASALPRALLDAAGAYARRPSRFELCLQRSDDATLHWIVGLALPQGGVPATVTWFLTDASEQRLEARRARFLRRMDALTHVLSAATAECSTLVDTGSRALLAARAQFPDDIDISQALQALSRTQAVLAQLAGFARRRARRPALRDLRDLLDQISPVLVHVTGDDVTWTMAIGDEPLYASLDVSELEQCLAAIVTQGREALPLGGQMRLTLSGTLQEGAADEGRGTRPEITIGIELQGYGLQPVVISAIVQNQVTRIGAELAIEQPDHLTTRLVLRLPRVFVTS